MRADREVTGKEHPYASASFISRWTFFWTYHLFGIGYNRELSKSDLSRPLEEHKSKELGKRYTEVWDYEAEGAFYRQEKPRLGRVIWKVVSWPMFWYAVLLFIIEIPVRLHQPYFVALLLRYFSDMRKNETLKAAMQNRTGPTYLIRLYEYKTPNQSLITFGEANFYAAGLCLVSYAYVFVQHPYMMGVLHIGMKIRVGICSLIYRKSLSLNRSTLARVTAGQIVNLMSNDVLRFDNAPMYYHYLWIAPIQTILITWLLYYDIGIPAILGSIFCFGFIPFQVVLGFRTASCRSKSALLSDDRCRQMNEIIQGMQVIKMYTWEMPFEKLIHVARKREISEISAGGYVKGTQMSFMMLVARACIFFSCYFYVLYDERISTEQMFLIASHYLILRHTMTSNFPTAITNCAEAWVAVKRIQKFMEVYDDDIQHYKVGIRVKSEEKIDTDILGIKLTKLDARWMDVGPCNLHQITMTVRPGNLVAIIGPVGAGKSTLLNVILNEISVISGHLDVKGCLSFSSQEPWLFAGSVRQNILFGQKYDREKYSAVCRVCALLRDFKLLPYGDRTVVGERGVSLSGGQRARVNLARAIYKEADIYLLDDPLSAVDTAVGKHIFNECITGYLKSKTVVLVTHQLQYLREVDHVVLMERGRVQAEGNYSNLQIAGLKFSKLLEDSEPTTDFDATDATKNDSLDAIKLIRQLSMMSMSTHGPKDDEEKKEQQSTEEYSGVKTNVFNAYFRAGAGWPLITLMWIGYLGSQVFASGGDWWVAQWVTTEELRYPPQDGIDSMEPSQPFFQQTRATYVISYSLILGTASVWTISRSFLFFCICMRSSVRLHDDMFKRVSRAHMRFFNENTSGAILNRFSKDMGQVDDLLPSAFIDFVQITLTLVGACIVICFIDYWLTIPTLIMCVGFYYIRIFYLKTARSLKKLEGETKTPVFSHLNASLQGLITIRAFSAQKILIHEFDSHQDLHSSAFFLLLGASRVFGYWLDIICVIYITVITYFFLFTATDPRAGGKTGLAITQVMTLIGLFQLGMRQSAEMENQMSSVERILEYYNIEQEPTFESPPGKEPPAEWPVNATIRFKDLFMRYSRKEKPVLKGLNVSIDAKEKIGIVGRTGAGKSSLISALFRLAPLEGSMTIDNINTKYIGLHELRKKLSIIPQEPMLFSGTMRYNLDPFDQYPDYVLYQAMERVEMDEAVAPEWGGLNARIAADGENFSVGQRQLVCLARALVRNNKILIMDEATANVDPQTDALIQSTIRLYFAECTVLTIAHRLNTVMDSDRMMVMDAGNIVEIDHPHKLLNDSKSFLYQMVSQTDPSLQSHLRKMAREKYIEKFGVDDVTGNK